MTLSCKLSSGILRLVSTWVIRNHRLTMTRTVWLRAPAPARRMESPFPD